MIQPATLVTGGGLLDRARPVVALVDAAQVEVVAVDVRHTFLLVQLTNEDDVDKVCAKFGDADVDSGATQTYSRTAALDGLTVRIFSGRTENRCACGGRCNHAAVAS